MFDETGVDGIMIGRGTLGNPWIFKQIEDELNGKTFSISNQEKLELILEHLNYMLEDKPERVAVVEMRKHISWYIKNSKDASKVRDYINQITDKDELVKTLTEYFNSIWI